MKKIPILLRRRICQTCAHWFAPVGDRVHGICSHVKNSDKGVFDGEKLNSPALEERAAAQRLPDSLAGDPDDWGHFLEPGPEFGCVHWEHP